MSPIDLTLDEVRGVPVARVLGEVDITNAAGLDDRLLAALDSEASGLVLDLTETTYLDSSGVKVLLATSTGLKERQQELRIVVSEGSFVKRVLEVTGLDGMLAIDLTVDAAVDALSRPK